MAFSNAGSIIDLLRQQLGLNEKSYAIIKIWEKEIGNIAKDAVLTGIKGGILIVEVTSNVHLQELSLRKREILRKMNQYFGNEKVVRDIKLKLKK